MSFLGTVPPSALLCWASTLRFNYWGPVLWDLGSLEPATVTIIRNTPGTVLRDGAALAQILVPEARTREAGVGYSQAGQA